MLYFYKVKIDFYLFLIIFIIIKNNMYKLGDKVKIKGLPAYGNSILPENSVGVIIKIRHRYADSPCEYFQYKVSIDGYDNGDDLTNLYTDHNLELIIIQ